MPRDIHTTVYQYSELSEDAQTRAVEVIREKLAGPWWDSADNDRVGEAIVYKLAERLQSPGWDTFGEGDYPGFDPKLTIEGWDLDRGWSLKVRGILNRDNAPALPWPDDVFRVEIGLLRNEFIAYSEDGWHLYADETPGLAELEQAWREACHDALVGGRDELEYMTGEEYAREWLEGNDGNEFTEDGELV